MSVAYTYDDNALREDLLNVMTNIDPTDTQLMTGLGSSTADSIQHQWLTKTLNAVGTNAYVEGVDASYGTLTNPERLSNWTQIFRKGYQVSDTERDVNTAAFNDRYTLEGAQALKELKNDVEYALMRGSVATGSGSGARQLQGVKNWLSLVTAQSGVSLTETALNDYLQNVWDGGTEVNAIYAPMYLKRKISNFMGNATYKTVESEDRRLTNAVDVYQADAAKLVKLFAHRHVTVSGDTNYDLVGINEDLFKVAYLRKPSQRELAKTGDSTKGEVLTEATLECLHQGAGFLATAQL